MTRCGDWPDIPPGRFESAHPSWCHASSVCATWRVHTMEEPAQNGGSLRGHARNRAAGGVRGRRSGVCHSVSRHRKVLAPLLRGRCLLTHCSALGTALLAFSEAVGGAWLKDHTPLARRTPRTLTDPDLVQRELHDARRIGLASDREEASPGLTCSSWPILARNGTARTALPLSMVAAGWLTPAEAAPAIHTAARPPSRT